MGVIVIQPEKDGSTYIEDGESARQENSRQTIAKNIESSNMLLGRTDQMSSFKRRDFMFGPIGRDEVNLPAARSGEVREVMYVSVRDR